MTLRFGVVFAIVVAISCGAATAMEIEWTRLTGQYMIESAPLIADLDGDGTDEIVTVNLGGQVLWWRLDGTPLGSGQDGTAAELPGCGWTSPPTLMGSGPDRRLLFCTQGRTPKGGGSHWAVLPEPYHAVVMAIDTRFRPLWRYVLPSETTWGRALPAVIETGAGPACCFGDHSGTVTCLDMDGKALWARKIGDGRCEGPPQVFKSGDGQQRMLFSIGPNLFCLDSAGRELWRRDLGGRILSRAEILSSSNRQLIVCGAGSGSLFALTPAGEVVWKADIGDEIDSSITFLPRKGKTPLILCTGVWGNLHAIDEDGKRVWTHLYRAKSRAKPLLFDANADGKDEIVVSTYDFHVYVFNQEGDLVDKIRVAATVNTSPVPIVDRHGKGILVGTAFTAMCRLRPGPAVSPYGETGNAVDVALSPPRPEVFRQTPVYLVNNPHNALLRTNVRMTDGAGWARIQGSLTTSSRFEASLPLTSAEGAWTVDATVRNRLGKLVAKHEYTANPIPLPPMQEPASGVLTAWSTPAYGSFDATRLIRFDDECRPGDEHTVGIDTLYVGEADQGAFVVASTLSEVVRARIVVERPKRDDGVVFGGAITPREAVPVASLNGEAIADALPELGDAGLVTISPKRAVKIWVSVDARGAQPGVYSGRIRVIPLRNEAPAIEMVLRLEVLNLAMPEKFPLALCTWDYVPSQWFPEGTREALDDMTRHGVNVFPRPSVVPGARVDAGGRLTLDWSAADVDLTLLKGRGIILVQMGVPTIAFDVAPAAEEKRRYQIAFIRAFRDGLRDRGWDYSDYAFYPVDEPCGNFFIPPEFMEPAELFREADPKLRIYANPFFTVSMQDVRRLAPFLDIWDPTAGFIPTLLAKDPRMKFIMDTGKLVWSYQANGTVKTLSPLCFNRGVSWRAHYFGITGIGFWTHSKTPADLWLREEAKADEFALVYPGVHPVPSVRWEAVRDGLEDVSAFVLLEKRMAEHSRARTQRGVVEKAEKALRTAMLDIMEMSDIAFVDMEINLRPGDCLRWHTWTDIENYRRHRKQIADLTEELGAG